MSATQEYLRNAVTSATPEQLQVMLLDGAIRFVQRAKEAIDNKDIEGSFNALDRAQRIIIELAAGMNRDVNPSLVDQFRALYNFIHRRLVDANLNRDVDAIEDALRILRHNRETWQIIADKVKADVHSQTGDDNDRDAGPRSSLSVEG